MQYEAKDGTRVLLVDDDDDLRAMLRLNLAHAGFEVHEAPDGARAITSLQSNDFDVVVIDLVMPNVSGNATIDIFRFLPSGKKLKTIVITGVSDAAMKERAMQSGAVEVLEKPFNPTLLVETIRRHVPAAAG